MSDKTANIDFDALVSAIRQVHDQLAAQAGKAVNISLTLRNWMIGGYIHHYQLHGNDRATYGEKLIDKLSAELKEKKVPTCERQRLYAYLSFFRTYPQIAQTLQNIPALADTAAIVQSLTGQLQSVSPKSVTRGSTKVQSLAGQFGNLLSESILQTESPIRGSVTPELETPGMELITKLSFTHLTELIAIDDDLKRVFYEMECIRGNWSVRELKRQIASLYYERSGLSDDKKKLSELVQTGAEQSEAKLAIRDPYIFEFLGIKSREVMSESDLENALLDKLEDFLLELGHGFCFEARQKRILIGNTYGFVDLVFYHRILKCHVLIDLKLENFSHENIGQLNTYVNWYKKNMMSEGDNPPVGILLCTQKDHALVEYALAGMDNKMFVSKYQLELPKKEDIRKFLEESISESNEKDK